MEQIGADHVGMVKFDPEADDNFDSVAKELKRIGKSDTAVISST